MNLNSFKLNSLIQNDSDIISLIAASTAITLSGLPFMGPLGATKIGMKNGDFIVNPTISELNDTDLELVVAGTKQGVLMVESEAHQLSESQMLEAIILGQESYKVVIEAIIDLAKKAAKDPWEVPAKDDLIKNLPSQISSEFKESISKAYKIKEKQKTHPSKTSVINNTSVINSSSSLFWRSIVIDLTPL